MNGLKKIMVHFFSIKNLLGFIVSGLCLYWSFSNFRLEVFVDHARSINYYLFILTSLFLVFSVLIRSIRWRLFFNDNEFEYLKLYELFKNEMLGYFGNNIFPLRLGDLLRVAKMSKVTGISKSYLLGTIVTERIVDIFSLLLLLLLLLPFFFEHNLIGQLISQLQLVQWGGYLIYILIMFATILVLVFLFRNNIKPYNI